VTTAVGLGSRRGRAGGVGYVVLGAGEPVTVLAHGLAGSVAETRPLATGLPGTRVLLTFRGHGSSAPLPGGWTYDDLADDLAAVADATGASRALGLSLGTGALLRLLLREPTRFTRVALVLPAALARTRGDAATQRLRHLAAAMLADDAEAVLALLLQELPASLRREPLVRTLLARRARALAGTPPPFPRTAEPPVARVTDLARVGVPTLVLAQRGDPLHPVRIARAVAAALPTAQLRVLVPGGVFWTARAEATAALATHLA